VAPAKIRRRNRAGSSDPNAAKRKALILTFAAIGEDLHPSDDLRQEPSSPFGLINPYFDQARGGDIFVAPASGGDGHDITVQDIDTNVQRAIWMPDSKSLLVSGHKDTDAGLWLRPLQSTARRLALGGVQPVQSFWLDASVSKTGAIAFAGSEPHHPTEVYYMASAQATPRRLTSYNDAVGSFDRSVVSQARRIHELSGAPGLEAPPERDVELRAVDVTRYAGLNAVPEQSLALLPAESA